MVKDISSNVGCQENNTGSVNNSEGIAKGVCQLQVQYRPGVAADIGVVGGRLWSCYAVRDGVNVGRQDGRSARRNQRAKYP